jgi:hypothetical protein
MVIANIFSHVGLMENAILSKDFAQCLVKRGYRKSAEAMSEDFLWPSSDTNGFCSTTKRAIPIGFRNHSKRKRQPKKRGENTRRKCGAASV